MGLVILGPFALPLVFRSPKLTPNGRLVAAGLIVLYTLYLVWAIYRFFQNILGGGGQMNDMMLLLGK